MLGRTLLAALGGLLMWVGFDYQAGFVTVPGIALLALSTRGSMLSGFVSGFVWGLAFFLPLTQWARISVGEPVPWIALSVLQALFIALLGLLLARLWSRRLGDLYKVLIAASIYVAIEIARSTWPWGGFPWGKLAYAHTETPLLRLAPYISSVGIAFLVAFLGFFLGVALLRLPNIIAFLSHVLVIVAVFALAILVPLPTASNSWLKVGWAQAGTPPTTEETRSLNVTRALEINTRTLTGDMDVMVWPESASDHDIRTHEQARAIVEEARAHVGVPMILGTQEYVENGRYNDVVVLGDEVLDRYSKSSPVPFGEYIPNREFFAKLSESVALIRTDMLAGEGPATVDLPSGVRLAVPICFEIAIDHVVRDAIRDGGQAIIVPVNTASFGTSRESRQQLAQTILRSVEFSRASIQVGTQGVSAVVLPNGVVQTETELWEPYATVSRIPLRDTMTFSARYGDIIWWVAVVAGLGSAGLAIGLTGRKDTDASPRHRSHL